MKNIWNRSHHLLVRLLLDFVASLLFSREELTPLANVRVHRNVPLAERARCLVPRVELYVYESGELRNVGHVLRRDSSTVAEDAETDDVAADGSRGFDHFLGGATRRKDILHHENVPASDELVVATLDDEGVSALGLLGVDSQHFVAVHLGEMMRRPLRENHAADCRSDDHLHVVVREPEGDCTTEARRLRGVRVNRILVDVRRAMLAGRVDDVAFGNDCADLAEDLQNFLLVHDFTSFLSVLVDEIAELLGFAASRFREVRAL